MSMKLATEVLGRFNLREALLAPQYADSATAMQIFQSLREADDELEDEASLRSGPKRTLAAYGFNRAQNDEKPFAFAQGLAIIPVHGMTINRFSSSWGSLTGYNFIRNQMNAALADPDVKGIVFDMNSNGGEAAGCFELCDEIRAARAVKPSLAIVDSAAYSAGYAIGSSATKMVAAPSAGVGSVGVVVMHASVEGLVKNAGVEITFIHAGAHKVDGNMFTNLPADVKKRIQTNINKSYAKFVTLVATNRGMDAKDVRDTEALTYNAEDALELGLIDAVATPQAAIAAFLTELSGSTTQKGKTMTQAAAPEAGKTAALTTEDVTKAAAAARVAERERMSAITGCDEAKDKPKLASHIAMNTEMSVDDAKKMLAAAAPEVTSAAAPAPQAPAKAEVDGFQAAMNKDGGTGVKAQVEAKEPTAAERILATQSQVYGKRQ